MFVYVMSEHDRDVLLSRGYSLIRSDERNGVYCFENVRGEFDAADDIPCAHVVSNMMMF